MLVTEFYDGQGFGNQLWSYATLRCLSLKLDMDFGVQSKKRFKGKTFLDLDMGKRVFGIPNGQPNPYRLPLGIRYHFRERSLHHALEGYEITPFDERLYKITDKTKIDGYFQSEHLIKPFRSQVAEWFSVKSTSNTPGFDCLINVRGGEYAAHPTLILGRKYFLDAMEYMTRINGSRTFGIVTDDPIYATKLLPGIPVLSKSLEEYPSPELKIKEDFSMLQNVENLILSNSSFSWWAAWTNQKISKDTSVVAPKYWARHNTGDGFWSLGDILTSGWVWLDKHGVASSSEECLTEKVYFESQDLFLKNIIQGQ